MFGQTFKYNVVICAAIMKIPGICFPYDMWYDLARRDNTSVAWKGPGVWGALSVLQLMGNRSDNLEMVTELSPSTTTHPLLQTVMDGRVDVAPIEVGITHQRYQHMDYSQYTVYAPTVIISKSVDKTTLGNFIAEIFDLPTGVGIFLSVPAKQMVDVEDDALNL